MELLEIIHTAFEIKSSVDGFQQQKESIATKGIIALGEPKNITQHAGQRNRASQSGADVLRHCEDRVRRSSII